MKCKNCKDDVKVMCRLGTDFCSTNCEKKSKNEKPTPDFAMAS